MEQASSLSKEQLKTKILVLKELCDSLDPFGEIHEAQSLKLEELGLQRTEDPFQLTNQLLTEMEEALIKWEELNKESFNFYQ